MDRRQVQSTRHVWAEMCRAVEALEADRQDVLSSISAADVEHLAWQSPTRAMQSPRSQRVMDHAAGLAENARSDPVWP